MTSTKNWRDVRAAAKSAGGLDEAKVVEHKERMIGEVRAYRLAEVRRLQQATQVAVAAAMGVTQSRVSRLEAGDLGTTELATLRKYVEALGGELRLVASFGDSELTVA